MQADWLAFFGTPERDRTATTASGGLGTIHYATGAYPRAFSTRKGGFS